MAVCSQQHIETKAVPNNTSIKMYSIIICPAVLYGPLLRRKVASFWLHTLIRTHGISLIIPNNYNEALLDRTRILLLPADARAHFHVTHLYED